MKFFLGFILAIVILGGGYYWLVSKHQSQQAESERLSTVEEGGGNLRTETAEGIVERVDRDAMAYDGPAYVVLKRALGDTVTVAVPSMGLGLCAAREAILDVYELQAGTQVEVRGLVGEDGYIVPCQGADHYFRVLP